MKLVVNALVEKVTAIFNVLVVLIVVIFVFGIYQFLPYGLKH
jgi:hypothetical protein